MKNMRGSSRIIFPNLRGGKETDSQIFIFGITLSLTKKLPEEDWEQSDKLPARWLVAGIRGVSLYELLSRKKVLF